MSDMYIGGQRIFLVDEAIYRVIHEGLDELNWFATNRQTPPVQLFNDAVMVNENMLDNTVAVSAEPMETFELEMGSNLAEKRRGFYVDVYGENLSVAKRLAGDIHDLLEFRFNFQTTGNVEVYDVMSATPLTLFRVQIENVVTDRSRIYERNYKKYWFQISFDVVDYYGSQDG